MLNSSVIILAIIVSSVGVFGHASSLSMDHMENIRHSSSSANCLTICMTGMLEQGKMKLSANDETDDEPTSPYYTQFHSQTYPIESLVKASSDAALTAKRPPKIPPYILFSVMRN